MGISQLSKYMILFLFTVLVMLSVLLGIEKANNKKLLKENTRLSEMVKLRDAAITEINKNIEALKQQVNEAESICNDKIKARDDLYVFLTKDAEPKLQNSSLIFAGAGNPSPYLKGEKDEIVTKNKSDYAVNTINSYWMQFTHAGSGKK